MISGAQATQMKARLLRAQWFYVKMVWLQRDKNEGSQRLNNIVYIKNIKNTITNSYKF